MYCFAPKKRLPLAQGASKEKLRETLKHRRRLRLQQQKLPGWAGLRHRLREVWSRHRLERRIWGYLAYRPPESIAAYIPLSGEIDLSRLMTRLHRRGWIIGLPCIEDGYASLRFRRWQPGDGLVQGRHQIWEPEASQPDFLPKVLLVPLLGFDRFGQRLGMGAGWYDRTFAVWQSRNHRPLKIGVAYEEQAVDHLPAEAHDQPLDIIATPQRLLDCRAFTRISI